MKTIIKMSLLGLALCPVLALAQVNTCAAKRDSIAQEIDYAQAHGNTRRVKGLQTAMIQLEAHCSDALLRSHAQKKVADAQKKLDERQKALQAAQADGKSTKKIAERQRKVDQAHAELEQAQLAATP